MVACLKWKQQNLSLTDISRNEIADKGVFNQRPSFRPRCLLTQMCSICSSEFLYTYPHAEFSENTGDVRVLLTSFYICSYIEKLHISYASYIYICMGNAPISLKSCLLPTRANIFEANANKSQMLHFSCHYPYSLGRGEFRLKHQPWFSTLTLNFRTFWIFHTFSITSMRFLCVVEYKE